MQCLSNVSHIYNSVRLVLLTAVLHGGEIRRGIQKSTVRFLHNYRKWGSIAAYKPITLEKDHHCAFIAHGEALLGEVLHHTLQERIVKRLTTLGKLNIETRINLLELRAADIADHVPRFQRFLIAALKLDNFSEGILLKFRVFIKLGLRLLVEGDKIADFRRHIRLTGEQLGAFALDVCNELPELRAPVAGVVKPDSVMSKKLQNSSKRITNDGTPQMADMHILCDIRRTEINNNALPLRARRHAQSFAIGVHILQFPNDEPIIQGEIDETGPRNCGSEQ